MENGTCEMIRPSSISTKWNQKKLEFKLSPQQAKDSLKYMSEKIILNEFNLAKFKCVTTIQEDPLITETLSQEEAKFQLCELKLKVRRKPLFYLGKLVFLYVFLTLMVGAAFTFDPSDIASRSANVLTLFLTAVAFHFVVIGALPKIPFDTRMDKFIKLMYGLIFVVYAENVAVFRIQKVNEPVVFYIDTISLIVLGIFVFLLFGWFIFPIINPANRHKGYLKSNDNRDLKFHLDV